MHELYTVKQVAEMAQTSVRTLHHYDEIGLLTPSEKSSAGYRLYSLENVETLQLIMFYRKLDFNLKEIKELLAGQDRVHVLEQQRELMKEKLNNVQETLDLLEKTLQNEKENIPMKPEELFPANKVLTITIADPEGDYPLLEHRINFDAKTGTHIGGGGATSYKLTGGMPDMDTFDQQEYEAQQKPLRDFEQKLYELDFKTISAEALQKEFAQHFPEFATNKLTISRGFSSPYQMLELKDKNGEVLVRKGFSNTGDTYLDIIDPTLETKHDEIDKDLNFELLENARAQRKSKLEGYEKKTPVTLLKTFARRARNEMESFETNLAQQYLPWAQPGWRLSSSNLLDPQHELDEEIKMFRNVGGGVELD